MPNRIIKESICTSKTLAGISAEAERLWWRLVVQADDHGCFYGELDIILGQCMTAFIRSGVTEQDVERWLNELVQAGLVRPYTVDGRRYLYITTWRKHQRSPRSKPKFPLPPDSNCGQLQSIDSNCSPKGPQVTAIGVPNRESRNREIEKRHSYTPQAAANAADTTTADDGAASAAVTEGRGDADSPSRRLPGSVVAAEIAVLEEQERAAVPAVIRQAFWKVTGRDIDHIGTVRELLDIATPELIAQTILDVGERERAAGRKIRTIRYFVDPVREAVERQRRADEIDYWLPDPHSPVEIERRRRKAEFDGQAQRRSETA